MTKQGKTLFQLQAVGDRLTVGNVIRGQPVDPDQLIIHRLDDETGNAMPIGVDLCNGGLHAIGAGKVDQAAFWPYRQNPVECLRDRRRTPGLSDRYDKYLQRTLTQQPGAVASIGQMLRLT